MERMTALAQTPEAKDDATHGPFWPVDVRAGGGVAAKLTFSERPGEEPKAELWRLSPLGAQFVVHHPHPEQLLGTHVDVELTLHGQRCQFTGLAICSTVREGDRHLLGVRWCSEDTNIRKIGDRRGAERWICGANFLPTCVATNPVEFNDLLLFRVMDVSKDGMRLYTSLRNKFLVPGMRLDGIFTFPMVGTAGAQFRIQWTDMATEGGNAVLALGAKFVDPSVELLQAVGQYALQFAPQATVEQLRNSGLKVKYASKSLSYSYVRSEQDYREVLELRAAAYAHSWKDKYAVSAKPEEMADEYDTRARILMARHNGKCVGSLRLVFHGPDDRLEQEKYIKLPEEFPRNDELIEVTRVCTHPEYRQSDVLIDLLKHCFVAMLQARRRWLIGSTPPDLRKVYEKIGCRVLPLEYTASQGENVRLSLMVFDLDAVLKGIGVAPSMWNVLAKDVLEFAESRHLLELDTLSKIRLAAYRLLSPFARFFASGKR